MAKDRRDKAEREADDHAGQMMREAVQAAHTRILDDPDLPEQPSAMRHTVYFTAVMLIATVLNLVVLLIIAR